MISKILNAMFFPVYGLIRPRDKPKDIPARDVPPRVWDRLNVFAGTFPSEPAATDYALGLTDGPSLSDDLGGVGIAPEDVEIMYGESRIKTALEVVHFASPPHDAGPANTYLLLADRGYDTAALSGDRITFVGQCKVA